MSDKELLELAAKAAGLRITWGEKYRVGEDEVDCTDLPYAMSDSPDEAPAYWNPLTDDGDALRLAVKLRFSVIPRHGFDAHPIAVCAGPYSDMDALDASETRYGADPCAATRRAIVRAAAEIGKSLSISPSEGAKRE